ncbi:hypothetical protein IJT93_01550 [bacterium]|nr:hypothetical protein [bacterium]
MICSSCRQQIDNDALTCPFCGSLIKANDSESAEIFGDIVAQSSPLTAKTLEEFSHKTGEAAQDLIGALSVKNIVNTAAAQSLPIREALRKLNSTMSVAKLAGETALYEDAAVYGGDTSYMQNAKAEITNKRIIFYERLFTGSSIMDVVTAFLPMSYSFSLSLAQITNVKFCEINYNPGLKISLSEQQCIYMQCEHHHKFAEHLLQALDNFRLQNAKA